MAPTTPRVNEAGRYICMAFEGFAPKPYICPAGVRTQGFGHTAAAGPTTPPMGEGWTVADGAAIFARTFDSYAARAATQLGPQAMSRLTDNQFSALASFVYNTGSLYLKSGHPTGILRAVREGRFSDVPAELRRWTRAGGQTLPGLVRRREAEAALWSNDPKTAIRLAGPIPLVDARGRVAGTVRLPSVTGVPNLTPFDGTPRSGEQVAPTATPPTASAEEVDSAARDSVQRNRGKFAGAASAGGAAPAATMATTSDWLLVGVVAIVVLGLLIGALVWWFAGVRQDADLHAATGTPQGQPLPEPEADPYAPGGPADPARVADNFV